MRHREKSSPFGGGPPDTESRHDRFNNNRWAAQVVVLTCCCCCISSSSTGRKNKRKKSPDNLKFQIDTFFAVLFFREWKNCPTDSFCPDEEITNWKVGGKFRIFNPGWSGKFPFVRNGIPFRYAKSAIKTRWRHNVYMCVIECGIS